MSQSGICHAQAKEGQDHEGGCEHMDTEFTVRAHGGTIRVREADSDLDQPGVDIEYTPDEGGGPMPSVYIWREQETGICRISVWTDRNG